MYFYELRIHSEIKKAKAMAQVVLCCFYVVLFVLILCKSRFFRLSGIPSLYLTGLFLLKILTATWLWSIFIKSYPASDADVFFNDSKVIYDTLFQSPKRFFQLFFGIGEDAALQALRAKMQIWNTSYGTFLVRDSRTMIRLNVLFRLFSFGYFYVHAVFMCCLSFTGFVYLYKLFAPYLRKWNVLLMIALFLFPSVLFWTSTMLKEGLIFSGLGLLLYHCQCGLRTNYSNKNVIGLITGIVLLVFVKVYVLMALCPALLANFWIAASNHKRIVFKYMMSYLFFLVLIFSGRLVSPSFDLVRILQNKQADFINVAKGGMVLFHDSTYIYVDYDVREIRLQPYAEHLYKLKKGFHYASFKTGEKDTVMIEGATDTTSFRVLYTYVPARSAFEIHQLKPSLLEVLKNAPVAVFNTLILPSLFTFKKTFAGFILAENLLLLVFVLGILIFFSKKDFPMAVVLFCFSFVVILFVLIGLTTPVLGALVRYRIPGIPFLIIGFALIADDQKIKRFYTHLKENLFKKGAYPKK